MDSRELLTATIRSSPMPGAPPAISRSGAWIGLSFLETVLRQNHIRRISESIVLQEHKVAERTVELDISLNLLDEIQANAGLTYSSMRTRRAHSVHVAEGKELLWVPVARLSRQTSSSLEVRNTEGVLVPRLTQSETGRMLAAGMYRLMRSILRADPRASTPGESLHQLLSSTPEARWMLQLAVATLFTEKSLPERPHPEIQPGEGGRRGPQAAQRDLACNVLEECADALRNYFDLLDIALHDYLIVVGLPSAKDEHHLRYAAPLRAVSEASAGRLSRAMRHLTPGWRGYRVSYSTSLPAAVRSYHLAVKADPELAIEKLVIASDADRRSTNVLIDDLNYHAERLEHRAAEVPSPSSEKILELELEATARTVAQLRRRRSWEAQQAGGHLHRERCKAFMTLASLAVAGHAYKGADNNYRSSLLVNPLVTPALLKDTARELRDTALFRDVSHGRDPASNQAHAYWRHPSSRNDIQGTHEVQASLLVTDAAGAGAANVGRFILAVMAVTYTVASSLYRTPTFWRWHGGPESVELAGPMVAVLLLVPGYLYSRLDLPKRTSIVARLRLLPRVGAYISIGSMALLAGYLTSNPSSDNLRFAFWAALGVQVLCAGAMLLRHSLRDRGADPSNREVAAAAPRWLYLPIRKERAFRRPSPHDVAYAAGHDKSRVL
jgi:hypothetical protein